MLEIAEMGARVLGGCCGTTPEYIKKVTGALKNSTPKNIEKKDFTVASSYSKSCVFDKKCVLIGERINPTGKSKFKTALRENNMDYIIANDLHDLRQGKHISYLVNKDGYCNVDFYSPDDIFAKLYDIVK